MPSLCCGQSKVFPDLFPWSAAALYERRFSRNPRPGRSQTAASGYERRGEDTASYRHTPLNAPVESPNESTFTPIVLSIVM
jgi:hypothetical protein